MKETKICKNCGEEKDISAFKRCGGTRQPNKRRAACGPCYYRKHKVRILAGSKRKYEKRRKPKQLSIKVWFKSYKDSLYCFDCGLSFKDQSYLCDFHHRDPHTKLGEVGTIRKDQNKKAFLEELAKCDPLCANCHRHRHHKKAHTTFL